MARDRNQRRKGTDKKGRRTPRKKVSVLNTDNIRYVDYKDVNLLRRFMSERAKIRARSATGNSAQQQRAVARAIRVAREMALLPYSVRQVTQGARGGRGRGRDRGDRGDRGLQLAVPVPSPDAPAARDDAALGDSAPAGGAPTAPMEAEPADTVVTDPLPD
jgi:small subunit ribosomal protein S18